MENPGEVKTVDRAMRVRSTRSDLPSVAQRLRTTLFRQSEQLRRFKLHRKIHVSVSDRQVIMIRRGRPGVRLMQGTDTTSPQRDG